MTFSQFAFLGQHHIRVALILALWLCFWPLPGNAQTTTRSVQENTLWITDQSFLEDEIVVVAPNVTLAIQGSSANSPLVMVLSGTSRFVVHSGATLYLEHVSVQASLGWKNAAFLLHPGATIKSKQVSFHMNNSSSYPSRTGAGYPNRGYTSLVRSVVTLGGLHQDLAECYVYWKNVTCHGFCRCLEGTGLRVETYDSVFYNNTEVTSQVSHAVFGNSLFWENDVTFGENGYNISVSNSVIGISSVGGFVKLCTSCILVGMKRDAGGALNSVAVVNSLSYGNVVGYVSSSLLGLRDVTALGNEKNLVVSDVGGILDRVNLIHARKVQLALVSTTKSMTLYDSVYWGKQWRSHVAIQAQIEDAHRAGSGPTSGFVYISGFATKPFVHGILSRLMEGRTGQTLTNEPVWQQWEHYAQQDPNHHSSYSFSAVSKAITDWLLIDEGTRAQDIPPAFPFPPSPDEIYSPFETPLMNNGDKTTPTTPRAENHVVVMMTLLIFGLVLVLAILYRYHWKPKLLRRARIDKKYDHVISYRDDSSFQEVELT